MTDTSENICLEDSNDSDNCLNDLDDLPNADLPNADLTNADLPSADLPNADLPNADLPSADLQGADLPNGDLSDGDFNSYSEEDSDDIGLVNNGSQSTNNTTVEVYGLIESLNQLDQISPIEYIISPDAPIIPIYSSDSLLNTLSIFDNPPNTSNNTTSNIDISTDIPPGILPGVTTVLEPTVISDIIPERVNTPTVYTSSLEDTVTSEGNNIVTNEFIEGNENIHDNDKNILNSLLTRQCDTTINSFYVDLHNSIYSKTNLKDYIHSLVALYNKVDNVGIYISSKYYLAKVIVELFKTSPVQKYFDSSFLSDRIVDYLIRTDLFYDNILSKLLIREWTIDYFKFKPNIKHVSFYKKSCDKLYSRLNIFLQNSSYYSYRLSDFTLYITFIKLMVQYVGKLDTDDSKSFIDSFTKLFLLILDQLYAIIHTSRTTLETITIISNEYISSYINITGCDTIKRLKTEIMSCSNMINSFFLQETFLKLFCESFDDFTMCDSKSHKYHSEIMSILPSLTNNWHYPSEHIDTFILQKYTSHLKSIFSTSNVNVHAKVKILGESNNQIFSDESVMILLIDYYSFVEKYDENSGFYDKDIIRFHIIKSLNEYIQPTIRTDSPTKLDNSYSLKQFDDINNKIQVFARIESYKFGSFITLLVSEVIEQFNTLEQSYKQLTTVTKVDIINIYKFVNCFDTVITNYKLIHLIITDKTIRNPFVINKYCELFSNILSSSFKNRLYCQLREFNNSSYNQLPIFSDQFIDNIRKFYEDFFYDLSIISEDEDFITAFIDNDSLYDRICLENTNKLIGFIYVDKIDTKIDLIINKFMGIIDKRLFVKNQTIDKYDEDIPVEFVDPIYYTPIENPIEIPTTRTIVEKKIIINHLVFNQTNPFDGLALSRESLMKYNEQDDVKQRLSDFIENFSNWKELHKI